MVDCGNKLSFSIFERLGDIKAGIAASDGVPSSIISISCNGKELTDNSLTLAQYGVKPSDTVMVSKVIPCYL